MGTPVPFVRFPKDHRGATTRISHRLVRAQCRRCRQVQFLRRRGDYACCKCGEAQSVAQ